MENFVDIVLTFDRNYPYPVSVCMTSILENMDSRVTTRFHLFVSGFTDKEKSILDIFPKKYKCKLIYYDMEKYQSVFKNVDVNKFRLKYISLATYYRLLIFKILPESIHKCFYVDSDMIVSTDLYKLFRDQNESTLASVVVEVLAMANPNSILSHLHNISDFEPFCQSPSNAPYFNAGFFLVNLDFARREHLFDQLMDFMRRYPNVPYADQDILNAVIGQKYHESVEILSPSYNVFCDMDYSLRYPSKIYSQKEIKLALNHPRIFHYGGANKPWKNRNCQHYFDIWWSYADISPWADYLNKIKPQNVINYKKFYLFGFIPVLSWTKEYF